jgi:hypothetical protein
VASAATASTPVDASAGAGFKSRSAHNVFALVAIATYFRPAKQLALASADLAEMNDPDDHARQEACDVERETLPVIRASRSVPDEGVTVIERDERPGVTIKRTFQTR